MKKTVFVTLFIVIIFILFGESVYVKNYQKDLKDKPDGKKIATVFKGTKMQKIYETDKWVKVALEGWIPKDALSKTKIADKIEKIPLSFKILETFPIENKSQVKVKITNITSKTITNAKVICRGLDVTGNVISEREAYVVFPNKEPLKPQASTEANFILNADYSSVNSFAFRIGKVVFQE